MDFEIIFVFPEQFLRGLIPGALKEFLGFLFRPPFHGFPDQISDESEMNREGIRRCAQARELDEKEVAFPRVNAIHAVPARDQSGIEHSCVFHISFRFCGLTGCGILPPMDLQRQAESHDHGNFGRIRALPRSGSHLWLPYRPASSRVA
jgi:hypothetical protein